VVEVGKLAVEAGVVVLYEIDNGELKLTDRSRLLARSGLQSTVAEYLSSQARFDGASDAMVRKTQKAVDERWERLLARAEY